MKLVRYNPTQKEVWSPLDRLTSLRDLFDSAFALAANSPELDPSWAPAMDVREDEENITVRLELAGMKKEDFDLSLESGLLTISGERKEETEKREGESFRTERFFGRFRRTVSLPSAVQSNKVKASYQDGILNVVLPKAEEAKPKKIEVKVA